MTVLPALAGLLGCLVAEPVPVTCEACHGSPPPVALGGFTDPTYRGVGAHAAHAEPSFSRPVACEECHVVPETVDADGHLDGEMPAEVAWEGTAKIDGVALPFDAEGLTCTVYCHGASLSDEALVPVWTEPGSAPCGSCHGLPPPPPHPDSGPNQCDRCHASIDAPELHIDGKLTLDDPGAGSTEPAGCTACHGRGDNPAPPADTQGNTDPGVTAVGAHEAHVLGGSLGAPVACGDCHVVPGLTEDPGHIDAAPAEVTFSGRARLGAASPSWSGTSCADTYCHGPAQPEWTTVDGSQVACGSCHALPPPPPHPANDNCQGCHGPAGPGQSIDAPALHIDGSVDF